MKLDYNEYNWCNIHITSKELLKRRDELIKNLVRLNYN